MLSLQRRFVIFCTLCYFFIVSQAQDSPTNQAYLFAADAESLLYSNLVASFSCQGRDYGYYADVPNNCQVRNKQGLSSTFSKNKNEKKKKQNFTCRKIIFYSNNDFRNFKVKLKYLEKIVDDLRQIYFFEKFRNSKKYIFFEFYYKQIFFSNFTLEIIFVISN